MTQQLFMKRVDIDMNDEKAQQILRDYYANMSLSDLIEYHNRIEQAIEYSFYLRIPPMKIKLDKMKTVFTSSCEYITGLRQRTIHKSLEA